MESSSSKRYETNHSNNTFVLKNPRNDDLMQYLLKLDFYILAFMIIFIIGILTNILNLFILTRKRMKFKTTNRYLSALAICDLFVLFFSQLSLSNRLFNDYTQAGESFVNTHTQASYSEISSLETGLYQLNQENDLETLKESTTSSKIVRLYYKWSLHIYPRIYPYTYPLAIMFQIGVVWLSVCMSIDRFIAISFPLKSLKFCTIKRAKRTIIAIFFFSFLYSLPRFFEYQTKFEIFTVNDNETYTFIHNDLTNLGKSTLFKKIIYVWMYVFLHSLAPLTLLTLMNIALIISLKKSRNVLSGFNRNAVSTSSIKYRSKYSVAKRRNGLTINQLSFISTKKSSQDITVMLIFVIVLFIFLQSPAVLCNCIYGFNYSMRNDDPLQFNVAICSIGNFFIMTNSTINFFMYFIFNKCFRKELFLVFQRISNFFKFFSSNKTNQPTIRQNSTKNAVITLNAKKANKEHADNHSKKKIKSFKFNKINRVSNDRPSSNGDLKISKAYLKRNETFYPKSPCAKPFTFKTPNKLSNNGLKVKEIVYYTSRSNIDQIEMKNFGIVDNLPKANEKAYIKFDFIDKYKADIVYL